MIRDAGLWSLYVGLDADRLDVMAYCPLEDRSLLSATIQLDPATDYVEAVEEAVYDNPLLLNRFKKVTVINRGDAHTLLPAGLPAEDPALAADILAEMTGDRDGHPVFDPLPLLDATTGHTVPGGVYNFLTRTFGPDLHIIHRLSVMARYCHGTHRGAGSLTSHVAVRPGSIDIILYRADRMLLANTYRWTEPLDAVYYILATRSAFDIDAKSPVVMSGDREAREQLMPLLRQYLTAVMPAVFPAAMFRAGGQTAMNAPLDLILMPLCE